MSAERFAKGGLTVDPRPDGGLDFSVHGQGEIETAGLTGDEVAEFRTWMWAEEPTGNAETKGPIDYLVPENAQAERSDGQYKAAVGLLSEELRSETEAHRKTVTWLDTRIAEVEAERLLAEAKATNLRKALALSEGKLADALDTIRIRERRLVEVEGWREALGSALGDLLAELKAKREAAAAPWEAECEIIEGYMPPFPDHDTQPKVVIRHKPSNRFLRHSGGPRQGHFWDIYGDHYQTVELAAAALSLSPHPTERGCNEPWSAGEAWELMKALPFDVLRRMNYRAGTLLIKVRAEARREDANARTEPDIGPEPAPMLALSRTEYELALAQGRDPWEESS